MPCRRPMAPPRPPASPSISEVTQSSLAFAFARLFISRVSWFWVLGFGFWFDGRGWCVGKRAFIAGVADDNGFGWAIAKALAAAGAEILVGTWVPVSFCFCFEFDGLGGMCHWHSLIEVGV